MLFKPAPLSQTRLDPAALAEDRRHCRRIGPCGVGREALYLNSFFLDRRYYVPFSAVTRVFKRVAMSQGGFTGKGIFASMPYLVVEFDNGSQKQCNFKYEEQVDELLALVHAQHPDLPCVSAQAEQKLAEERRRREEAERRRPPLTEQGAKVVAQLNRAADHLRQRPALYVELSAAAQRRRANQCARPTYGWAATAITLLGLAAMAYGVVSFLQGSTFAIYFTLFGLAAIFTFAGLSVLPTARNNRHDILQRDEKARAAMEDYVSDYADFPLPGRYAHPVVLDRMVRAVLDGRAASLPEALSVVKADLKALNAKVQVSQEEFDEVVAIKALFLNADYQ